MASLQDVDHDAIITRAGGMEAWMTNLPIMTDAQFSRYEKDLDLLLWSKDKHQIIDRLKEELGWKSS